MSGSGNGQKRMRADWPMRIVEAQRIRTTEIRGVEYERIPFGAERDGDWGASRGPCHDCAVIAGQLHVPGCDVERCPACGRQAISCPCTDEEDDEED